MNKEIWGLGINCFSHDSSAALLRNGQVIFTAEEERFDRKKHSQDFPEKAIKSALHFADLESRRIDYCTFFFKPFDEVSQNMAHFLRYLPSSLKLLSATGGSSMNFFERFRRTRGLPDFMSDKYGIEKNKFQFVEHHLAHAGSVFYPSPFEESAILTWDGRGESTTILHAEGVGHKIKKLSETKVPHSLGHLYSAVTVFLGFRAFHDEWKVMGMSAYGTSRYVSKFNELADVDEAGRFRINLEFFQFHVSGGNCWISKKFIETFGRPRRFDDEIDQHHFDIAYALQKLIEKLGLQIVRSIEKKSKSKNLCITGGVALNVLLNKKIIEHTSFNDYFIQPVASDAGTSFGSALYFYHNELGQTDRQEGFNPYLGEAFMDSQIESVLIARGLTYSKPINLIELVAKSIFENKIVGWFQGRQECGPRALGNRSILANPCDVKMKDRLNRRVKRREFFRPFAPSVIEEACHQIFKMPKNMLSPYMILAGDVHEDYRCKLPAVTHNDGTARVHTVKKEVNPRYWELINKFGALSGIPVVLNTSFNENEPIVNTPEEAINCFLRTDFDVLAIGPFLISNTTDRN